MSKISKFTVSLYVFTLVYIFLQSLLELSSAESKIALLQDITKSSNTREKELEGMYELEQDRCETLKLKIQSQNADLEVAQAKISSLVISVRSLEDAIKSSNQRLEDLEVVNGVERGTVEALNQTISAKTKELEMSSSKIVMLTDTIRVLEDEKKDILQRYCRFEEYQDKSVNVDLASNDVDSGRKSSRCMELLKEVPYLELRHNNAVTAKKVALATSISASIAPMGVTYNDVTETTNTSSISVSESSPALDTSNSTTTSEQRRCARVTRLSLPRMASTNSGPAISSIIKVPSTIPSTVSKAL